MWARDKRKRLAELTPADCRRWLTSLKKEVYSVSSINGAHAIANVFLRFLITEGDLKENPFEQIPYLPREKTLARHLTHEEVHLLMSAPDVTTYVGLLDRVVMELLYATGMRVTELIGLRPGDVKIRAGRIICTGKGSKQRVVLFGRDARAWLERYLAARDRIPGARKSPHLFLVDDGEPIYATYVWRHVKAHGMRMGLGEVTPRTLRHTFATHLHEGGASIRHVQELLGHADMQSTEVYTHMAATHLRKTIDQCHPRARLESGTTRSEVEGGE